MVALMRRRLRMVRLRVIVGSMALSVVCDCWMRWIWIGIVVRR